MPRPKAKPPAGPNSIIASAANLTARRSIGLPASGLNAQAWQAEVETRLGEVGELEFYRSWVYNTVSRVRLTVVKETPDGDKPITQDADPEAWAAHAELFGGADAGQGEMLGSMAVHVQLPGETWVVGIVDPDLTDPDAPDQWRVLASTEVKHEAGTWVIDRGDGRIERYADGTGDGIDPEVLVLRVWRPNPFRWAYAHSACKAALPILSELVGLDKRTASTIDSRLAGAGVLFMPTESTFATPVPGQIAGDPHADELLVAITNAMDAAIRDQRSASARVPIIVRIPGEMVQYVKHLTFDTPFDGEVTGLRTEARERLATTLDVPAEILTGMGDINHWGQWFTDETGIKVHVAPLVDLLTDGLRRRYLWAALMGQGVDAATARTYRYKADYSALTQDPDHSDDAGDMHDKMIITDAALAAARGYNPDDLLKRGSDEWRARMLAKLGSSTTTPDVALGALAELGITITPQKSAVTDPGAGGVDPGAVAHPIAAPGQPATELNPGRPPAGPSAQAAALMIGSELTVGRAVERAWNRVGNRTKRPRRAFTVDEMDASLCDAWGDVPRVAAMSGVSPDRLEAALNKYARALLSSAADHDPLVLQRVLQEDVLTPEMAALGG